ncbi:hypothetical protein [Rouxiella sp. Mn2063]|uniref:hypothetical protein n=1 Tax=Rouxiella sp. Mn2063 TaxID=3395262 RepID=UPI003BBBCA18
MPSNVDIAKRIAKILLSPETAVGLINGILSVPTDIGYLAFGFIDTDSRRLRETDKIRMVSAIRYGILENQNIKNTIETVLRLFNKDVPEEKQNAMYSKTTAAIAGRTLTNSIISSKLAAIITQRSTVFIKIKGGLIGNVLLAGGMAERSVYTSERLQLNSPEVYSALRPQNYDLLYFLAEPVLNPFVEALNVKRNQGKPAFDQIINMVESEINAKK